MRRATPLAIAFLIALGAGPAAPARATGTAGADRAVGPAPASVAARPAALDPAEVAADNARSMAPATADGRYIVLLKDGSSVDGLAARASRLGVRPEHTFRNAVHGFAGPLSPAQVAALRADPDVDAVVPDERITMAAQSIPTGVRRVNDRDSQVAGIDGADPQVDADVAIIDTGIGGSSSRAHEDLNIVGGISCATKNPDNWGDPNGHGTHVAGTVGAVDNGMGVVGVAPGVRLWAVRILDSSGAGLVSWYVCGLDWIAGQRDPLDAGRPLIEAANMSVAKDGSDDGNCGFTNHDAMHRAVCRLVDAGVTVVAAAGNDSANAKTLRPASYNEVITVSALADTDGRPGGEGGGLCYSWGGYDRDDTFADFSNYGSDVDLIAPGKCIWSTLPGNRYGYLSGTSMATPHVTGAAALYRSSRPDATPAETKAALIAAGTADWNTATDPDSVHEPLLDTSHLVALGDFTVDLTPNRTPSIVLGGAGTVTLPVRLFRAEDFGARVDLTATADAPLTATLADTRLIGQDAVSTTLDVTVPADTATGSYTVEVSASDGTRTRRTRFAISVDTIVPTAVAPVLALRKGGILDDGVLALGTWSAANDAGGSISQYELRWRVDGDLGPSSTQSASDRDATHRLHPGHTYALRLRARDDAGNWSAWVESAAVTPALSQDTSTTLVTRGGWTRYRADWTSGGTAIYSGHRGATVTREFTGRAIAWIGSRSAKRGKARITIDGTVVATVDTRRSGTAHRWVIWTRSWARAGDHTLTITVLGTKGRKRVDVDAFVIVP